MLGKNIRLSDFENYRKQNHEVFLVKSHKEPKNRWIFARLFFCKTIDIIPYYLLVKSCQNMYTINKIKIML